MPPISLSNNRVPAGRGSLYNAWAPAGVDWCCELRLSPALTAGGPEGHPASPQGSVLCVFPQHLLGTIPCLPWWAWWA